MSISIRCRMLGPIGRATSIILASLFFNSFWLCPSVRASSLLGIDSIRNGSWLKVSWGRLSGNGRWALTTASGHECVRGVLRPGQRDLVIDKVASDTELRFSISTTNQSESKVIRVKENLSQLQKVGGSAVIYQLPIRTWLAEGRGEDQIGKFGSLTPRMLAAIKELGVDYLWLTGVPDYASPGQSDPDVIKGNAGSYYAIQDSWDVDDSLGTLDEFRALVDRVHAQGLRVLIDLVPNHTARTHKTDVICKKHLDFGANDNKSVFFDPQNSYFYLQGSTFVPPLQQGKPGADGMFDMDMQLPGIQLENPAKVSGNDVASSNPGSGDWFETAKLNYGYDFRNKEYQYQPVPSTWKTMLDIGRYWLKFGVDGFRVDYAHAVPLPFWKYFSQGLKAVQPEVFLVAEAYESDVRMRVPGFSYRALLESGFDSVYNSQLYWDLRSKANPLNALLEDVGRAAGESLQASMIEDYFVTNYLENHDEVRLASPFFASGRLSREQRGVLGYNYSVYAALMPANFLLQGGQELAEAAEIFGPFAGDNGRTSIFDRVYQESVLLWRRGQSSPESLNLRSSYKRLFTLKKEAPFAERHGSIHSTYIDLKSVNRFSPNPEWIQSYIRFGQGLTYLVVNNSSPYSAYSASIHFTAESGEDTIGALAAMNIPNSDEWYVFEEMLNRPGLMPKDPEYNKPGFPGRALYKSGGVPSGFHIGTMQPGETLVFCLRRDGQNLARCGGLNSPFEIR